MEFYYCLWVIVHWTLMSHSVLIFSTICTFTTVSRQIFNFSSNWWHIDLSWHNNFGLLLKSQKHCAFGWLFTKFSHIAAACHNPTTNDYCFCSILAVVMISNLPNAIKKKNLLQPQSSLMLLWGKVPQKQNIKQFKCQWH